MNFNDKTKYELLNTNEESFNKYSNYKKTYEIYKRIDNKKDNDKENNDKEEDNNTIKRTLIYTNLYNNLSKKERNDIQDRVYWKKFGSDKNDNNNKLTTFVKDEIYFEFNYSLLKSKKTKQYICEQIKNYLNDEKYEKILINVPFVKTTTYNYYKLNDNSWNDDEVENINKENIKTNDYPIDCDPFYGDSPIYEVEKLFNNLINNVMDGKSTYYDKYKIKEELLIIKCDDDKSIKAQSMSNKINNFNIRLKNIINRGKSSDNNDDNNTNNTLSDKKCFVPPSLRKKIDEPKFINVKDTSQTNNTRNNKRNNTHHNNNIINNKCIRLSNLPEEITREDLEDWLRHYRSKGVIRFKLNTFTDRTQNNDYDDYDDYSDDEMVNKIQYIKNFAFIEFRSEIDCEKALEVLERQTFFNTIVHIELAQKRKPRD